MNKKTLIDIIQSSSIHFALRKQLLDLVEAEPGSIVTDKVLDQFKARLSEESKTIRDSVLNRLQDSSASADWDLY